MLGGGRVEVTGVGAHMCRTSAMNRMRSARVQPGRVAQGCDSPGPPNQVHPDTHALTIINNVIEVVNYMIAAAPSLLNFMIADTTAGCSHHSYAGSACCTDSGQTPGKASGHQTKILLPRYR